MVMTRREWHRAASRRLTQAGCEDGAFDALCLIEQYGALPHGHTPDDTPLTPEQTQALDRALQERTDGRPLQYILGEWDFLTLTLSVGEGVLIPRPDTEVLCELAAALLNAMPADREHRVLDLCAGSGCVGLGIASLCPGVQVTAVEYSPQAAVYLERNIARYPQYTVTARRADVLADAGEFPDGWDAIVANPPYIPTADLADLQREVRREPRMALDGDADGLRFYRMIMTSWCSKLAPGGFCAVEVGISQAEAVRRLMEDAGLTQIRITDDYAGIPRVVSGARK